MVRPQARAGIPEGSPPAQEPAPTRTHPSATPWVWVVAALTALLRLPYAGAPMSPDEGGFLVVAHAWHRGSSLYGDLWVDRPPLLLAVFRVADLLGGQAHALTALRLIGCLAAALTVAAVGLAARVLVGGRRGPVAAAAVAGALLVAVAGGGSVVNGELVAAPFIGLGLLASLHAARPCAGADRSDRSARWALLAGASGAAAILVKQNMLDVAVFLVVLLLASAWRDRRWSWAARQAGLAVTGGLLASAAVLLPAWAAGTTPWGVFEAMYPFRLRAAAVMNVNADERVVHGLAMVSTWMTTGAPLLILGFAVWALGRGRRDPRVLALLGLLVFDGVSIAAGGSFWLHYVVQLVVPTGLAAGVIVARTRFAGRATAAVVLAACLVGWATGLSSTTPAEGDVLGASVAGAARPGDSVASLLGDADVVRSSGLTPAAYPFLWSLPARTLDPGFRELARVLAAPDRPTWVVVRGSETLAQLRAADAGLERHYRRVAVICTHPVFLRDDVSRPVPTPTASCRQPFLDASASSTNGETP
ncbi:MAG: hypothetical protein JWR42_169 [Marmoricola sp.]|nr:hypothetical protein [Marmoricola sp.]